MSVGNFEILYIVSLIFICIIDHIIFLLQVFNKVDYIE